MLKIRPLREEDVPSLGPLLERTEMFSAEEVACALELVDLSLHAPHQGGYYCLCAAEVPSGRVLGWTCYGPTPLTRGTYDLYWIAVDPTAQGTGIGSRLLQSIELTIRERKARLLLTETSSQPKYSPTRNFYGAQGFQELARIRDFYAPGDDQLIYGKYL